MINRLYKPDLSKFNLIRLLKQFSQKEVNEFDKFIRSPFFNNQSTLIRFYSELKKFYPEFNHNKLTKENLYNSVNPGSEYNDIQLRKYFSNTYLLAEEYLICLENNSNIERKKLDLMYQFDKRHLSDFYNKIVLEFEDIEKEQNKISSTYFCNNHFLEELKFTHYIRVNELDKIPPSLINSHNFIILQLLLMTAVYSNILLINKKVYKDSWVNSYFEEFLKFFDFDNFYKKFDSISDEIKLFIELCKYDILLSKDSCNEKYLLKMKELVFQMSEFFNDNLLYTFISHLNIYYYINIHKGIGDYENEVFLNYKFMVEKGIYYTDGVKFVSFSEFRSILFTALNLSEFKWAEDFITEYGNCFPAEVRSNYLNFSLGCLNFEKKNYEKALEYFSALKLDELILKLDVNVILAQIYYELNYIETALSLSDSFKHFINSNNTISSEIRNGRLDFLKYYRLIINLKSKNTDIFKAEKIKKELIDNMNVTRKKWLLIKLNEIMQ